MIKSILGLLHLSSDHRNTLNPLLGPVPISGIPDIDECNHWLTISGATDAFINVLFATTSLARRQDASVQAAATLSDLLISLLTSSDVSSHNNSEESGFWDSHEDVYLVSTRLTSACLINLGLLHERCPNPNYLLICLEKCLAASRLTPSRFSASSQANGILKKQLGSRRDYQASLEKHICDVRAPDPSDIATVGLAISGIFSVISMDWPLLSSGLSVQTATVAVLADQVAMGVSGALTALADGVIGLTQAIDLVNSTMPSEFHLNEIQRSLDILGQFVIPVGKPNIVAVVGLPVALSISILCKHSRGTSKLGHHHIYEIFFFQLHLHPSSWR